jgi:hypothetical protein
MTEVHPTQEACLEALDRIARTPDGAMLYVFLQRRLMTVLSPNSRGALRQDNGERMFAAKLIGGMAKGILESGGRTGSSTSSGDTSSGEQPIVVPGAEPRRVARTGNPGGRRITPDTRVPGYDPPDEA